MSHHEPNFCAGHGALVGASREVPERPEEFVWPTLEVPPFGCNHLVCSLCGALVKHRERFAHGVHGVVSDLPARLYEADDWEPFVATRALVRDANIRMYVCRCTMYGAAGGMRLDDPYYDDFTSPAPQSWSCHGHPVMTLPTLLDGEHLDVDTDWGALVRGAFAGTRATTRPIYTRYDAAHWVERLYFGLAHTVVSALVLDAIRAARADPDATVAQAAERCLARVTAHAPQPK